MKITRSLAVAGSVMALTFTGIAGVAVASPSVGGESTSSSTSEEGPEDQAAQDAACEAAGVDLTASNIQYDDETGECSLDGGGQDNDDE